MREGWTEATLGEVTSRLGQRNRVGNGNVLTISAQHGLVSQEEFFQRRVASADTRQYYLLRDGDFAYNKSYSDGYPAGVVRRLDRYKAGVVSPLYICFRSDSERIDSNFLNYYFESGLLDDDILWIAKEGVRNHGLLNVKVGDFFSLPIKLPPLAEQRRIAEILDNLNEQIRLLHARQAKLELQFEGLVASLLRADAHWSVYPVGNLGDVVTGNTPEISDADANDSTLPFITPTEISPDGQVARGARSVSKTAFRVRPLPVGATLTVCIGFGTGRSGFLEVSACTNQQINAIVPSSAFDPYFVFLSVQLRQANIRAAANLQVTPIINKSEFSRIEILAPTLPEQQQISATAAVFRQYQDQGSRELTKLTKLKSALMDDLLTGRVRVLAETLAEV